MRILILGDMEGVSGVSRWGHVLAGEPLFEEGRLLYTQELNAAVRGAAKAGADDIIVVDGHGAGGDRSFNSAIRESLEENCRYFSQYNWLDFEELLQEGCDAALIVGMHAMAGTPDGVLAHTASYDTWVECRINDKPIGETGILSAFCAHYGCPVVMVSGDHAACREAESLINPPPITAAVKQGKGQFSAIHLHPQNAHRLIEEKAAEALRRIPSVGLYRPEEPCTIDIELNSPEIAQKYLKLPGVEPSGECKVHYTAETCREAWKRLW